MNIYVYSLWAYRVELTPFAGNAGSHVPAKPRHVDVPFDETYVAAATWVQRMADEPRIPCVEGFQFLTIADPEVHFMFKATLLRPVFLGPPEDANDTRDLRVLRAYQQLCSPPEGEEPWPRTRSGPDSTGPFERGLQTFIASQKELAEKAQRKCIANCVGAWSMRPCGTQTSSCRCPML